MLDAVNHTKNLRGGNHLAGMVYTAKAKSLHGTFLTCGTANNTSDLFDSEFFFCHNTDLLFLTVKHFIERYTTELSNHIRILHLEEGIDGSLNNTVGI